MHLQVAYHITVNEFIVQVFTPVLEVVLADIFDMEIGTLDLLLKGRTNAHCFKGGLGNKGVSFVHQTRAYAYQLAFVSI